MSQESQKGKELRFFGEYWSKAWSKPLTKRENTCCKKPYLNRIFATSHQTFDHLNKHSQRKGRSKVPKHETTVQFEKNPDS